MVRHADLEPLGHNDIVAVGWLEPGHDYTRGPVSSEFAAAFFELATDPWQPFVFMGFHSCGFCRLSGSFVGFQLGNRTIQVGCTNLFVPAESTLYVCPSLMIHYADAHEYAPPEEFTRAVLACPPMRSMAYLKAIRPFADRLRNLPI